MSGYGAVTSRTTSYLSSQMMNWNMQKTSLDLFRAQQQVASGNKYAAPSEGSGSVSAILQLKAQLDCRKQWDNNLEHASLLLNNTDAAFAEMTGILQEATSIASGQVGSDANSGTREDQAVVIDQQIQSLLNLVNQQTMGVSLFGGNNGAAAGDDIMVSFMGGYRYTGGYDNLTTVYGANSSQPINTNGKQALGEVVAKIESNKDYNPKITGSTKLSDLAGATGQGINKGSLSVTVNSTPITVDLSNAQTLDDVALRLNTAINKINPGAGKVIFEDNQLALEAGPGNTISINDIGTGSVASELGIEISATGSTTLGKDLNPRMTTSTKLVDLSAPIDFTSGLKVTQGDTTKTIDFSSCVTVEDMMREVEKANMGIHLEINESGTAFNLVNEVSGTHLTVGENGGTTAQNLGIATLGDSTELASFRDGAGVESVQGKTDFKITTHNGTSFEVDVTGALTVEDVINRVNDAASAAGLTVGTDFSVGFASDGTGITFTDNTTGAVDFEIKNINDSLAAEHLGIVGNAGGAKTFTSKDNAKLSVNNIFTDMQNLFNALNNNDTSGITFAASKLEGETDRLILARATVATEAKRVSSQQSRSSDLKLAEESMLKQLEEVNPTEVASQYALLQVQMSAILQLSAQNLQNNLMDYLR